MNTANVCSDVTIEVPKLQKVGTQGTDFVSE